MHYEIFDCTQDPVFSVHFRAKRTALLIIYIGKEGPTVVPIRTLYGRKRDQFWSSLFRNVFFGVSLQATTELDVILNSTKAIAHRGVTVYSELLFHRIITSNSTHSYNDIVEFPWRLEQYNSLNQFYWRHGLLIHRLKLLAVEILQRKFLNKLFLRAYNNLNMLHAKRDIPTTESVSKYRTKGWRLLRHGKSLCCADNVFNVPAYDWHLSAYRAP